MTDARHFEALLGQLPLKVPVYRDAENTQALVDRVNARIAAAEKQIGRIDSYAAALLAAYLYARDAEEVRQELAVERERAKLENNTDDAELVRALGHIAEALENLLKAAREQVDPDRPQQRP